MTDIQRRESRALDTIAQELRHEVEQAEQDWQSAVSHAIRAGELLAEAKSKVKHGEWLPWLEANFQGSERTAQSYMRLAQNPQRVADLPTVREAVAALAAPKDDDGQGDVPAPLGTLLDMAEREAEQVEQEALANGVNPHLARAAGHIARAEGEQKALACGLIDLSNHSQDTPEFSEAAWRWAHLILAAPEPWELADAKEEARGRFAATVAEMEAAEMEAS